MNTPKDLHPRSGDLPQARNHGEVVEHNHKLPGRNNNNPSQPTYGRRPSQSRQANPRRKIDDDELSTFSGLSYATPVTSNTKNQKIRKMKKKDSDTASDITPIISNIEYGVRYSMESSLGQDYEAADDYQQNESTTMRMNTKNIRRSSMFSVSSGTSGLFSIPSDQVPVQLRSKNSSKNDINDESLSNRELLDNMERQGSSSAGSAGSRHDSLSDQDITMEQQSPSTHSSSFRSTHSSFRSNKSKSSKSSFKSNKSSFRSNKSSFKSSKSRSSRSISSDSINNEMMQLRNQIELDEKRSNVMWGQNNNAHGVLMPFILCTLFFIQYLLSSFSTLSCRYVTCNIGFEPLNVNFQQSKIDFGFWTFSSQDGEGSIRCMRYPTDFSEMFIEEDSMWLAARIIGMINIVIGSLVLLMLATVIGQKVLHCFEQSIGIRVILYFEKKWKDFTLYCSVILLLWELVKFVFTRINICSEKKWMNEQGEMVAGQGCSISKGGICTICAVVFDIIIILMLIFSDKLESKCLPSGQDSNGTTPSIAGDKSFSFRRIASARLSSRSLGSAARSLGGDRLSRNGSDSGSSHQINDEDDFASHDINLHSLIDGQRNGPNNSSTFTAHSRQGSARSHQGSQRGQSSYTEISQDDNNSVDNISIDSSDSDQDQTYPTQPSTFIAGNLSDHGRNSNRPTTKTSIGLYSNVDDSLGMPKC